MIKFRQVENPCRLFSVPKDSRKENQIRKEKEKQRFSRTINHRDLDKMRAMRSYVFRKPQTFLSFVVKALSTNYDQ